jgi:TetR/AcrR family transcriptional repressor of nem operon
LTTNLLVGKNREMNTATTREQLLSHAQVLIRQRGYNGFSYRDLAERVGVRTASIHYYFPTKDDLLIESIDNYAAEEARLMQGIDPTLQASERLNRYAALFYGTPADQVCLCGMLAADFASLSDRARQAVQSFYRTHERWLSKVVADGQRDGTLEWNGDPDAAGRYLFAAFQGALMSSRLFQTPSRLHDVVESMRVDPRPD